MKSKGTFVIVKRVMKKNRENINDIEEKNYERCFLM